MATSVLRFRFEIINDGTSPVAGASMNVMSSAFIGESALQLAAPSKVTYSISTDRFNGITTGILATLFGSATKTIEVYRVTCSSILDVLIPS